jgi:spermidine synthase
MKYKKYPSETSISASKCIDIRTSNFPSGKSTRLLRSLPGRVRFYLQALLEDLDPPASEGYVPMVIDRFDGLMSMSANGKPFIYSNSRSAYLHFNMLSVHSEMDIQAPFRLALGYTQTMMGFLFFHRNPASIAMIGLGGGSLPKYCHLHLPNSSIVVLENNSDVIALRDHFLIPRDDARLSVQFADGADFVKKHKEKYDVLIVDGFDRTGQPPQLCSQEFYDNAYQMLDEDGIMVVNLIDIDYVGQVYMDRIRRSFDNAVIVVPAFESLNKIVFACKGTSLQASNKTLIKRLKEIAGQHTVDLYQVLQSILRQRQLESVIRQSPARTF